jgi:hypothetical protein
MGKWKIHGCPKCGGSLIVDKDEDGWYESCINCSFRNDLTIFVEFPKKADTKVLVSRKSSKIESEFLFETKVAYKP